MKLSRLLRYAVLVLLAVTMGVVAGSVLGHLRELGRAQRHTEEAEQRTQDHYSQISTNLHETNSHLTEF